MLWLFYSELLPTSCSHEYPHTCGNQTLSLSLSHTHTHTHTIKPSTGYLFFSVSSIFRLLTADILRSPTVCVGTSRPLTGEENSPPLAGPCAVTMSARPMVMPLIILWQRVSAPLSITSLTTRLSQGPCWNTTVMEPSPSRATTLVTFSFVTCKSQFHTPHATILYATSSANVWQ